MLQARRSTSYSYSLSFANKASLHCKVKEVLLESRRCRLGFKRCRLGFKRSLVCIVNKACLQCKEALFGVQRNLVLKRNRKLFDKPKSVIRPKQAYYKRICLSFLPFSAFVSSSCRRPRFAITRYGFNTNVAIRSKPRRSRQEIQ